MPNTRRAFWEKKLKENVDRDGRIDKQLESLGWRVLTVWLLENARRLGTSEHELLVGYPQLRAEDLVNAWAYARSHAAEIADQIRQNEEA